MDYYLVKKLVVDYYRWVYLVKEKVINKEVNKKIINLLYLCKD